MSLPTTSTTTNQPVSSGFCLKSSVTESILSRKIKHKSRPKSPPVHSLLPPITPIPSATISRLQSFGRNCLNSLSRNKDQSSPEIGMPIIQNNRSMPQQKPPVRQRKSSGIVFAKIPSSTRPATTTTSDQPTTRTTQIRRRPLSQFVYLTQKPTTTRASYQSSSSTASTSSSSSSTFYKPRPHSTFIDSPRIFSSSKESVAMAPTTKNHNLSNTSLSSSSSSSCCSTSTTLSSSNTSSKSEYVKTLHRHQSNVEQLTALDFLLDDRPHQDNGHHPSKNSLALEEKDDLFFSPTRITTTTTTTTNNSITNKKNQHTLADAAEKKHACPAMHRMSVPVRSCSSLFQPARHKHKHKQTCHHRQQQIQQQQQLQQQQQPFLLLSMGQRYQSEPSSPTSYHHSSPMNGSGSTSLPSSTCSLQLSSTNNNNNDGNRVVYGNSPNNGGGGNNGKTGRKRLTSFESPLLLPSRARSVLGMKDHQQKEEKAMMAWRTTVTQLDQEEKNQQNNSLSAHRQQVQWNIPPRMTKKLDAKTELKWLAYRKFIINEIYSTEKSYHELLLLVKKRYMIPMLAASRVKDPLVKFNDIPILFNHLSTLIELCEKILAGFTLERQEETHQTTTTVHLASAASSIGYQWLQLHDDWAVFLKYAVHYEVNTKTIKRACNNALLLKIEQESLTRKETNRMGMADYLIAPIQRVPRYCLLLKDLLRHTPTTDADYHYLVKVVNSMIGLAKAMNDTQKMHRRKTINL